MAGEHDDLLRAEGLGGQDGTQADGAVADHGDGLAGAGLRGDGGVPAGAEHIRGGEVVGQAVRVRGLAPGHLHEGAVGELDAHVLRLAARVLAGVDAAGLVAGLADLARVVREHEGADHEVADLEGGDVLALLHDRADVLVAHAPVVDVVVAAVGPQVRAAHARGGQLQDHIRGLSDARGVHLLHDDVARRTHDDRLHRRGDGRGGGGLCGHGLSSGLARRSGRRCAGTSLAPLGRGDDTSTSQAGPVDDRAPATSPPGRTAVMSLA